MQRLAAVLELLGIAFEQRNQLGFGLIPSSLRCGSPRVNSSAGPPRRECQARQGRQLVRLLLQGASSNCSPSSSLGLACSPCSSGAGGRGRAGRPGMSTAPGDTARRAPDPARRLPAGRSAAGRGPGCSTRSRHFAATTGCCRRACPPPDSGRRYEPPSVRAGPQRPVRGSSWLDSSASACWRTPWAWARQQGIPAAEVVAKRLRRSRSAAAAGAPAGAGPAGPVELLPALIEGGGLEHRPPETRRGREGGVMGNFHFSVLLEPRNGRELKQA